MQTQNKVRDWKFWIQKVDDLYYLCSESKGAGQLCHYYTANLCLCFRLGKVRFSREAAHIIQNRNQELASMSFLANMPKNQRYAWCKKLFFFFLNSFLCPFQDYFSSYETGQSVGGRKREDAEKNHLAHPQAELGLSHMWPVIHLLFSCISFSLSDKRSISRGNNLGKTCV